MSYDSVLQQLGEFSPYQLRIFCLIFVIAIFSACQDLSVIFQFQDGILGYRCAVPNSNDTFNIQSDHHQKLVNSSIVFDEKEGRYSQCSRYEEGGRSSGNRSIVSCQQWVYEPEVARTSLTAEFDFVCDREVYKTHFKMLMMAGKLVAALVGGYLIDLFGRKRILIVSNTSIAIVGTAFAFSHSVAWLFICRFLLNAFNNAALSSFFVLMAEFVAPGKRAITAVGVMFGWAAGMFLLDLINYFIRDWRLAQLVISVPFFLLISYIWLLPESPRWLLVNNKEAEAEEIIHKIARSNKVTLPASVRTLLISGDDDPSSKSTHEKVKAKPWHLFTNRTMFWRIAVVGFNWLAINLVYYGLTLNMDSLIEGDTYVNFAIVCVTDCLAFLITMVATDRMGRKKVHCVSILISGVACMATAGPLVASTKIIWLDITLFTIGRLTISVAFTTVYVVTPELMPTSVRNFGFGFCSFLGRIGGVISPYIADLRLYVPNAFGQTLPLLIFGLCSIVAGLMFLTMPETRNLKLPDTIEEAEAQGKDNNETSPSPEHKEAPLTTVI